MHEPFQAPGLTFSNCTLCPHTVFTCSAGISEQTATVFLHRLVSLRWRVFTARYELNIWIYLRLISIFKQLRLGFDLRPVNVRSVLDKVTLEQVFLQVLRFSLWVRFHHFTISPIHHFNFSPFYHFTNSPIHQFTTSTFHHFTTSTFHQFTTSTFHHLNTSPFHQFTTSTFHHFTTSPFHQFTTSTFHHFTTSPLHYFTTSPFHQFTTSTFHHFTTSPFHLFTTSTFHHFTTSPFYHFTTSLFHHFTISPLQNFITSTFHHSLTTCFSYQTDNRAKPEALLHNNNNNKGNARQFYSVLLNGDTECNCGLSVSLQTVTDAGNENS